MINCKEDNCDGTFIYLINPETGKSVPVDYHTITEEEFKIMATEQVYYNKLHHVSHFKTCKNPNRFSRTRKK